MAYVKQTSTDKPVEVQGLREESFSLDLKSTNTIISLLAHMYSRPNFSAIREVVQNAKDAGPGPVQIKLPSELDPTFVCADAGKGMSAQNMRDLLQQVGASDKRGDAQMAGNLGIGSIAPMSIADTMTISSVKDGLRTILNVWKDDAGDIKLAIQDSTPAKGAKTGTTVTVPIHRDLIEQIRKSVDVFRFSPRLAARLVVDGEPLEPYLASIRKTVKVGEHEVAFSLVSGSTEVLPGALVLMNDIPMGAALERFPDLKEFNDFLESHEAAMGRRNRWTNTTMVIDVPALAGLSFPPSREVIAVTRLNAAFLSNACKRFFAAGTDELKERGLFIGCESAVLSHWKSVAMAKGVELRSVQNDVQRELNKHSKYLRVDLGFAYWANNQIPTISVDPKIPSECGARLLQAEYCRPSRRRSANTKDFWRLQTCGLVPLDTEKPELGDKLPFASTHDMKVVTWTGLGGLSDWSQVLGQNLKAKQALFELVAEPDPSDYRKFDVHNNVLVLLEPLPEDHPLLAAGNVVQVDFGSFLAGFTPDVNNPYVFEEETEEVDESTGKQKTAIKQRHPRLFVSSAGTRRQLGLPIEKPFPFIETLRDNFIEQNWGKLPVTRVSLTENYSELETFQHWMKLFENAGIGDGYDAVQLIPSEAKHIKRPHVRLVEALSVSMDLYLDELTPAEYRWLPFAFFRVWLKREIPGMERFFKGLYDRHAQEGTSPEHPELKRLLCMFDPPPGDRAALFVKALGNAGKDRWNAAEQFLCWFDRDLKVTPEKHDAAFGFPARRLQLPLRTLKRWLGSGSPLTKWTRLLWMLHHQNGFSTVLGGSDWINVEDRAKNQPDSLIKEDEALKIAGLLEKA